MDAETILKEADKTEEVLEKRTKKIINWLKNPYNLSFIAIITFTVIIRLHYFFLTKNQPIWWDEAEYLNMARTWAFGLDYNYWTPVRPVLFSFITAIFFKISYSEFLPRAFMLLLSISSVIGMYYLGKEVYDKKVGLLASFFASVFYLNLFFTYRLQMDMPSLTFFTLSSFFFYRYFRDNSNHKALYWAVALIAVGTMFKQNTAFLLPAIFVYILITDKLNFIKKKELWMALAVFFLVLSPYIIWGYAKYGGFILTQSAGEVKPEDTVGIGFDNLKYYIVSMPVYLSWVFVIIFLSGLALMYKLFLGLDILIKKPNKELKRNLFLILVLVIPLLLNSFMINHYENRYAIHAFPAIFMISGFVIFSGYNLIKKQSRFIAVLFLIGLLGYFAYFQVWSPGHADDLIKNKLYSYGEVKQAGLWLKENSEPSDIIITNSLHQIAYYAERKSTIPPPTPEEFEAMLESDENIKYLIVSIIQVSPEWAYSYPQEKTLEVAQAYFADINNQQPVLMIYRLR